MKKILLSFAVACVATFAFTQKTFAQSKPTFGIKAGVSLYTLGTAVDKDSGFSLAYGFMPGFQGGVTLDQPINNSWSFAPQLLFTQKGGKGSINIGGFTIDSKTRLSYLELPLLFKYKAEHGLNFYIGPQVSSLLGQTTTATITGVGSGTDTSTENFNKIQVGGNLGVGYNINSIMNVNLHYSIDFMNVASGDKNGGERNSGFALTIGYSF